MLSLAVIGVASGQDDDREDDVERVPMMPLGSGVGDGYGPQWW
ncbi:MAG: hypothetical protein ABMA64_01175 [Myxococcota bacterium]